MTTQKTYLDHSDIPGAIGALAKDYDTRSTKAKKVNLLANAAGQTLTVSQNLGILLRSGAAGVSDTTPTAAAIVAALANCAVGDVVEWEVRNNNTGTLTLLAGSGVTLEGTTTVATVSFRKYAVRLTNVTPASEAVTISGLFTALV
jgi:hypothetical protein